MPVSHKQNGFTLIETIIYIALFSIIFVGIFASVFPIFKSAERLTKNIAIEGESAFILSKINYAINNTITGTNGTITTPAADSTATELILSYNSTEKYRFAMDTSGTFCAAPLLCQMLTVSHDGGAAAPLNASRVNITNFSVTHVGPSGNSPRHLDVSFDAGGVHIGPVRYYLNF
jgi:prepilin-type N-terminal cleavage/methylation domain-containing protein